MQAEDDEDDDDVDGLYEEGRWVWDEIVEELVFLKFKDATQAEDLFVLPPTTIVRSIEFKDDIDLIEQQKFRKRFARKLVARDVVTLQDVRDVVLLTAPIAILTPAVINLLHLVTTERFLRALILFNQYYLQIADEMGRRLLEMETKIRTAQSIETEAEYRVNLEDLRLLVAKEYSCVILGSGSYAKYHHMGAAKKLRSLSKKDAVLFETVLRISIQIVWIALGRKSFNQIELQTHRIFKSHIFNVVEHKLKTNYEAKMSPEERSVLLGHCARHDKKLTTRSPLINEVFCPRPIDYRMLGLGSITFENLNPRLRYFEHALTSPEIQLDEAGLTLGIIGLLRARFDTMLKEIPGFTAEEASGSNVRTQSQGRTQSRQSKGSQPTTRKSATNTQKSLYLDMRLPPVEDDMDAHMPDHFPSVGFPQKSYSERQRRRWLNYLARLKRQKKRKSTYRRS